MACLAGEPLPSPPPPSTFSTLYLLPFTSFSDECSVLPIFWQRPPRPPPYLLYLYLFSLFECLLYTRLSVCLLFTWLPLPLHLLTFTLFTRLDLECFADHHTFLESPLHSLRVSFSPLRFFYTSESVVQSSAIHTHTNTLLLTPFFFLPNTAASLFDKFSKHTHPLLHLSFCLLYLHFYRFIYTSSLPIVLSLLLFIYCTFSSLDTLLHLLCPVKHQANHNKSHNQPTPRSPLDTLLSH